MSAQLLASLLIKMPGPIRAFALKAVRPTLTESDREALRGGTRGVKDAEVQVSLAGSSIASGKTEARTEKIWKHGTPQDGGSNRRPGSAHGASSDQLTRSRARVPVQRSPTSGSRRACGGPS